ncbi:MAG: DUF4082 domain-containing protein, partial [Planctomycetota bacterium]|nr:DUF4082 domain-containing protein [Planctomycetota bacterium]
DLDNNFRPAGLLRLSSTTESVPQRITDNGSNYAPGTATHRLTLYRDVNAGTTPDALVFGAGTVQWSWGLDGTHDRGSSTPDARMQQATINLFADMNVQPATLQTGLTAATASSDTIAPTSTITYPLGVPVESGSPVTITGTATDNGGVVGGVEVSIDGGATWHPATGRENWTYTWTPAAPGSATVMSRAADDSGNLETPSAGTVVTVNAPDCPCSIWGNSPTPTNTSANDGGAIEVGVKFRSDSDGYITGLRFYKGSQNTGTHVGHLWTSNGTKLAEVTFTGETASGWQQVALASPVAITANTTYVASYHTTVGRYAFDGSFFATSGVDNAPLHALANGADGPNGVYKYSPTGTFPTDTFNSSNYWVDVVFDTTTASDTTPPTVSAQSPSGGATNVGVAANVTATFSEAMDAATINGNTFELRDASNNLVSAIVTYVTATRVATLDPASSLAYSTNYTATI